MPGSASGQSPPAVNRPPVDAREEKGGPASARPRPVVELAKLIERAWLDKLPYGLAPEAADRIRQDLAKMRIDLAPESPLEQLVVEQVLAHWLALHVGNLLLATGELAGGSRQRFLLALTDSSQRRLDLAMRTLATVRRLGHVSASERAGQVRADLAADPLSDLIMVATRPRPGQSFPLPPDAEGVG